MLFVANDDLVARLSVDARREDIDALRHVPHEPDLVRRRTQQSGHVGAGTLVNSIDFDH